jgi:hypothetical protein
MIPDSLLPVFHENEVAMVVTAFRTRRSKARRYLRRAFSKKENFFPLQLLVEGVLEFHGLDLKQWHDWKETVMEGVRIVYEEGW